MNPSPLVFPTGQYVPDPVWAVEMKAHACRLVERHRTEEEATLRELLSRWVSGCDPAIVDCPPNE